ncbi:MAG TPA: choice-of-anchor tandem repeat GloVer-containing protein, partial [Bacteroidia bacterium]|nr:choice-of-anchor tandem repeat GloVer-containing protein [Bacteroidia bacterium]
MKKIYFLIFTFLGLGIGATNAQYTILHTSTGIYGQDPWGSLTLSGGKLFGMMALGGTYFDGVIFSMDTNGNNYKVLLNFNRTNGLSPYGSLTISGEKLYGMAHEGGAYNYGCIFCIDSNGANYKDLWDFTNDTGTNGSSPLGSLTLSGHKFYGMTEFGGGVGNLFSIDTNGRDYRNLHFFYNGTYSGSPMGSLLLSGGQLFGMTEGDGPNGNIFSIDTNGNGYKDLFLFNGT